MQLKGILRQDLTRPYDFVDERGQKRSGNSRTLFIDDSTSGIPVVNTLLKVKVPKGTELPELSTGDEVELSVYYTGSQIIVLP